jgi:hypothetical protein
MSEIDLAAVVAELEKGRRTATMPAADHPGLSAVPERWRQIAQSDDAEKRRLLAVSLWNRELLDLIPGYAEALRTKLIDVRVCVLSDEGPVLVYIFEASDRPLAVWIGWDPNAFGDTEPVFWETIPAPARTFLRHVHAGYTWSTGWDAYGLIRPKDMTTLAQWAEHPDGIPNWSEQWWEDCDPIDSRRLLLVGTDGSNFDLCTSPDLSPGAALTNDVGHLQVGDFGEQLDSLMLSPLIS